jgi:tRNA pseudouridine55 synthase
MQGVLIVDKPAGLTSHDVVARVRRLLRERRVGHTGTLDPFATGVLVVLVGRATRLAQFLAGAEKEYLALVRLGMATDTGDLTGKPQPPLAHSGDWSDEEIEAAMRSLRGEICQVPPMYSAKKSGGKRLYEVARRGLVVERSPVRVSIFAFEALRRNGSLLSRNEDGSVDLAVRVVCSAGTYVRVLAEDLGTRLGIGAHLRELRRVRAGSFGIESAISLADLPQKIEREGGAILVSTDTALSHLPFVHLSSADAQRARNGLDVEVDAAQQSWTDGAKVKMRDHQGTLLGIGSYDARKRRLHPGVVISE